MKKDLYLLPHQIKGLEAFASAKAKNTEEIFKYMFAWKPRAGKTIGCLTAIKRDDNAKAIIVMTSFPVVLSQWIQAVETYAPFQYFNVIDISQGDDIASCWKEGYKNIIFVSLQDITNFTKEKFNYIRNINFDYLCFDEAHHSVLTERTKHFIQSIKYKNLISLSGTPEKNIVYGDVVENNINFYGLKEENEYRSIDARYARMPKINLYLFDTCGFLKKDVTISEIINDMETARYYFHNLFNVIKNMKKDCILMTVASCEDQYKLQEVLNTLSTVTNSYDVHIANSQIESNSRKLLLKAQTEYVPMNGKGAIIIVVDQLRVGTTLPFCNMVIHADNGKSSASWIQTTYRCQSPKDANDMESIVIDLVPNRGSAMYAHMAKSKEFLNDQLNFFPLFHIDANLNIVKVEEKKFSEIVRKYPFKSVKIEKEFSNDNIEDGSDTIVEKNFDAIKYYKKLVRDNDRRKKEEYENMGIFTRIASWF